MRRPDPALADLLFDEPYRFDFFQAVRLLERIARDRAPVGHDAPPALEAVRFVSRLALTFPPSPIDTLERPDDGGASAEPPRMRTTFMGLVGAAGSLPTVYTESLLALQSRGKNAAALAFLDLFHHRLVSLFYRAWEKYNVPALFERGGAGGSARDGGDPFSMRLFDLVGLGLDSLRGRQAVADRSLAFYAGLFAQQHRSAVALEAILRDHFGRPAAVLTFFGQWLHLREDQRSRMGIGGAFHRLGVDTVAGRKVWDDQSKFRVRLGPLGFDDFLDFLPGGRLVDELTDLIRFFARDELDFDVQLVLKAEEVPPCRMSSDPAGAARLGRTSWLKCGEFARDADDAIVRPVDLPRSHVTGPFPKTRAGG